MAGTSEEVSDETKNDARAQAIDFEQRVMDNLEQLRQVLAKVRKSVSTTDSGRGSGAK